MRRPSSTRAGRIPFFRTLAGLAGAGTMALAIPLGVAGGLLPVGVVPAEAQRGPQSVAPVAEKLINAVVNISTSQLARGPQGLPLPNVPKGSPFEEFFEDFFENRGGDPNLGRKVSSLGSGFVIDGREGLIVTNNHVITDADEIIINFSDGSKLKVDKVIGRDPKTDLALLKVTPRKPLPEVKFGSSERLRVGDWVMAIGNPFGLGGSVTVGIISAKERDINSGPYDDYLQTDAAINKGNSGGPLFDMDGFVVGVNTAIISPTGGSIGIGFAVPADTAVNVIAQLKEFGETRRGWLGVRIQSVTEDLAANLGVPESKGALVAGVEDGSPAAEAGIETGDVILRFDGKDVNSMRGLPRLVAQTRIGARVPVEVVRDGKPVEIDVTIGRLKESETEMAALEGGAPSDGKPPADAAPAQEAQQVLGLSVSAMTDGLRSKYRIDPKVQGLVVTGVAPDSAAGRKAIKEGDVIVEAAQTQVATVEDLDGAIARVRSSGRKAILLRVEDARGDLRFIAVPLE